MQAVIKLVNHELEANKASNSALVCTEVHTKVARMAVLEHPCKHFACWAVYEHRAWHKKIFVSGKLFRSNIIDFRVKKLNLSAHIVVIYSNLPLLCEKITNIGGLYS